MLASPASPKFLSCSHATCQFRHLPPAWPTSPSSPWPSSLHIQEQAADKLLHDPCMLQWVLPPNWSSPLSPPLGPRLGNWHRPCLAVLAVPFSLSDSELHSGMHFTVSGHLLSSPSWTSSLVLLCLPYPDASIHHLTLSMELSHGGSGPASDLRPWQDCPRDATELFAGP